VRAAWKYYRASGDRDFLRRAFPRIELAIEGALDQAVDGFGFLTHGDGETWMDAGGEAHPYTPRGNRAVEVQALFHHGLLVGAAWARELARAQDLEGPAGAEADGTFAVDAVRLELSALRWDERARSLRESFTNLFWNVGAGTLYDHLNADGSPDGQIRPNAILALWVSLDIADLEPESPDDERLDFVERNRLITHRQVSSIVSTALETICLEHGITSLSPDDPAFHPRHLNLERYYYDEAYHNGDVWEWLSGPMASCLLAVGEVETAWNLVAPLVDEILDEACVGSLREIRDGLHDGDREEFGGATSQAWSLAEFIRVCHTGFVRAGLSGGDAVREEEETGAGDGAAGFPMMIARGVADQLRIPLAWGRTRFLVPMLPAPPVRPPGGYLAVRGVAVPGTDGRKRARPLRRHRLQDH
jgi:glycogen debranching enzyme